MKTRLRFTALFALCHVLTSAQPALQVQLDTVTSTNGLTEAGIPTTDGGFAFLLRQGNGSSIWRSDANGIPLWRKSIGFDTTHYAVRRALAPDSAGYLLCAQHSMIADLQANPFDPDTLLLELEVVRLDAAGGLVWGRKLNFELVHPWQSDLPPIDLEIERDDLGSIVISALMWGTGIQRGLMIKLSSSGTHQWTKWIGRGPVNSMWFDSSGEIISIASDGTGGYFGAIQRGQPPNPATYVFHFDAMGDLDWMKLFEYTNSVLYHRFFDLAINGQGNTTTFSRLETAGTSYLFSMEIDPVGIVRSAHLYTVPQSIGSYYSSTPTASGGVVISAWDQKGLLLEIDTAGAVVAAAFRNTETLAPYDHTFFPTSLGYQNGNVFLAGNLQREHQVFGTQNHWPGFWSFEMDPLDACFLDPEMVTAYAIPDSLIAITEILDGSTLPVTTLVQSISPIMADLPLLSTTNMCDQLVGIEQGSSSDPTFHIQPSIANAGDLITVRSSEDIQLAVIDLKGRLVTPIMDHRGGLESKIATSGSAPGLYFVRAMAPDGSILATMPFVLN